MRALRSSAYLLTMWAVQGCIDTVIHGQVDRDASVPGPDMKADGGQGGDVEQDTYAFASMGRRCSEGATETWLVLSKTRQDCAAYASSVDEDRPGTLTARIPDDTMSARVSARSCPEQGSCTAMDIQLTFDRVEEGTAGRGRWSRTEKGGEAFEATWCDADSYASRGDVLVRDLSIQELSLYQGVEIPLARDGNPVSSLKAPIVAGRPGLLRVFVEPSASWRPRTVVARLEIEGQAEPLTTQGQISGPSTRGDLASTLNLDLPPALLSPGLQYHVSLLEAPSCAAPSGTVQQARFPATGSQLLDPVTTLGRLRVVVVPISYAADGSNRLPDTSPEQLAQMRASMFGRYPLSELEISVRAPVTTNQPVTADGGGWTALVDAVAALRQSDGAPPDTYYYGMFRPAETLAQYCGQGCTAGIAVDIPPASDLYSRASIGLGYMDPLLADTFTHEIGHVLGRRHAPCGGAGGPDPAFPYTGGLTGSWGFDVITRALKSPETKDFMGYCDPSWVSDYTYVALLERLKAVTAPARALVFEPEPRAWRTLIVDVDASLAWGHHVELRSEPPGASVPAVLLDARGAPIGPIEARFASMTHVAGGIIFVEEPTVEASAVSIEGFGVLAF